MSRGRSRLSEWTVVDTESKDFTLVRARSQKEAAKKGMRRGYIPKTTNHCPPPPGAPTLLSTAGQREFLEKVLKN